MNCSKFSRFSGSVASRTLAFIYFIYLFIIIIFEFIYEEKEECQ